MRAHPLLRSIFALVAGYLVSSVLTAVTIGVLAALFPASYTATSLAWVGLNLVYSCVFAALGGYATARLAPNRPIQHALGLGLAMAALSALMAVTTVGNPAYADSPAWYYPALAVTVAPSVWLGGWLRERRRAAA